MTLAVQFGADGTIGGNQGRLAMIHSQFCSSLALVDTVHPVTGVAEGVVI